MYFYTVGDVLGVERLSYYARDFGLGQPTGVDLPGEVGGFVPTPEWKEKVHHMKWLGGDTLNMSIGQGFLAVSPLQMANIVALIANEGRVYRPSVLLQVRDAASGAVLQRASPELLHVSAVRRETFQTVQQAMRKVITEGTANVVITTKAVEVAGKTGTGEAGFEEQWHSWFAAYAPYQTENPEERVVVVVMVEAVNPWEWWAPKAADVIFQGIFAKQTFEEAVETLRPWWYLEERRKEAATNAHRRGEPVKRVTALGFDFILLAAALLLLAIGILFIYSSGVSVVGGRSSGEFLKQLAWAGSGLLLLVGVILVNHTRLRGMAVYLYGLMILLLLVTRFVGREVHGARSWLGVGDFGIQPSEFAKITTILMLAVYLTGIGKGIRELPRFLLGLAIVLLPVGLILLQPDMGTALVYFPIFLFMSLRRGRQDAAPGLPGGRGPDHGGDGRAAPLQPLAAGAGGGPAGHAHRLRPGQVHPGRAGRGHGPVGLGLLGFQTALFLLDLLRRIPRFSWA